MPNTATHDIEIGDRVTASRAGRADNVQYIRENVTGTVTKLMGAMLAFRGDEGGLYFAEVRNVTSAGH